MFEVAIGLDENHPGACLLIINNPIDSVCDYLAELLYEDPTTSAVAEPIPVSTPATVEPMPAKPASVHLPSGVPQIVEHLMPQRSAAKALAPPLAEPRIDKARLTKLLNSAQTAPTITPAPVVTPSAPVGEAMVSAPQAEKVIVQVAPVVAPVARAVPHADGVVAPADEIDATQALAPGTHQQEPEDIAWCENGRPPWAQKRFDVLLFTVYGLTLAVPLVALGQIQPLNDELTPLFGQAKWFMGLQPTPMGQVKTVNTALFVMPERYNEAFLETAKYVISIDGLDWGLAVDSVQQPKSLDPDDIKWRGSRSQRPWLAGTVKEHMCALLDIPNLGRMLAASDHNRHGKAKVDR